MEGHFCTGKRNGVGDGVGKLRVEHYVFMYEVIGKRPNRKIKMLSVLFPPREFGFMMLLTVDETSGLPLTLRGSWFMCPALCGSVVIWRRVCCAMLAKREGTI